VRDRLGQVVVVGLGFEALQAQRFLGDDAPSFHEIQSL